MRSSSLNPLCVVFFVALLSLSFSNEACAQQAVAAEYDDQAISLMDRCEKVQKVKNQESSDVLSISEANLCLGYLQGIVETLIVVQGMSKKQLKQLPCIDTSVTYGQYIKVLQKSAANLPEALNDPRIAFVLPVLAVAYPCN